MYQLFFCVSLPGASQHTPACYTHTPAPTNGLSSIHPTVREPCHSGLFPQSSQGPPRDTLDTCAEGMFPPPQTHLSRGLQVAVPLSLLQCPLQAWASPAPGLASSARWTRKEDPAQSIPARREGRGASCHCSSPHVTAPFTHTPLLIPHPHPKPQPSPAQSLLQ